MGNPRYCISVNPITCLSHLIFPPVCLNCQQMSIENRRALCPTCSEQMTLLDTDGRCLKCFVESSSKICQNCRKSPSTFKRIAACFAQEDPANALLREFSSRKTFSMAKDIAALMMLQFCKLDWPMPDFLIPLPISFLQLVQCGYQKNLLLAREMAKFIEKPVLDILRIDLLGDSIRIKKKVEVSDQTILIVFDQINRLEEIHKSSELLLQGAPKAIYALGFSKVS